MRRINLYAALIVAASQFAAMPLRAQAQSVELVTRVEREIEVLEKGVKIKKTGPPEKVVPGDDVIYTVTYTNKTGKPADNITVTNPVPAHTRYRDGSAVGEGATITFSVDGGKTFATPDKLTVAIKDKSGKDITRPAAAADYTHIRWVLKQSVAPGQSGTVRFRAVVL